jgi:hypothetical protein
MSRLSFEHRSATSLLAGVMLIGVACGSEATGSGSSEPPGDVARVEVSPAQATVDQVGSVQLRATAYSAGSTQVPGRSVTWSSSASTVASVSEGGFVTGVTIGNATITATVDGRRGSAAITVVPRGTSLGTISVSPTQTYQIMTGWEASAEIGHVECDPRAYQAYRNEVFDRAVNEVGISRIAAPIRNGYENPVDPFPAFRAGQMTFNEWKANWFRVVNDNADPMVINPAGFNWGYLDYVIEQVILPLKQRWQAKGLDLWWSVSYTGANSGQLHRDNPEEYAELILAAFQHIQQKYSLVPNSLELVNEPNLGNWPPQSVGNNLVAVKRRLNAAGFFPQFVGPTASGAYVSGQYFDLMAPIPGVLGALNEISYHRFGETLPSYLQGLAQRAAQHGMRTAMLEMGGSGHEHLHEDLTLANVSAWKQFGLAFCGTEDGGGMYFLVAGAKVGENAPVVHTARLTKFLRQYFRYVRLQALRVGASSSDARFAPVAFRNADGKYVVVVKAAAGGAFTVGGLPAGTYGIDYTTSTEYMRALPDVTIGSTQAVSTSIPASGVLTIFAK